MPDGEHAPGAVDGEGIGPLLPFSRPTIRGCSRSTDEFVELLAHALLRGPNCFALPPLSLRTVGVFRFLEGQRLRRGCARRHRSP